MDLKKVAFSDQFPYCVSSTKRKVVSGFSFGVVICLIVLSVVLFNVSFKAPFLNPMFQGHNSFGSHNNASLFSWPFSFSNPTSLSYHFSSNASANATYVNETHVQNGSEISKNGDFVDSNGGILVSEKIFGRNSSEEVKNGSFCFQEGAVQARNQKLNGSLESDKNAAFLNCSDKGVVLEKTHLRNVSNNVKNGSFSVAEGVNTAEKNDVGEDNWRNSNGSLQNLTVSEKKNQESSSEKGNKIIAAHNETMHNGSYWDCDIFNGRWVRYDSKPYYPAGSCPYIDRDFDCHLNGRPDDGFLRWKWQPYGCDIPSLNATDFLERLRGKKLVFVGDSLNRNMWESLVCILRHSIKNKKRVYEISGRKDFKKKGFYAFLFEDYNCSVDFVSAPFLVRESSFKGRNGSLETLRLDLMDQTTSMYHDADVVIFNTGHWWTHEKTSKGEDYYQEGNHVYARLKVLEAYKRALTTWAKWIDKNINGNSTQVLFRGYSVTHFRGGLWNSGGQCHKETEPIFNQTHLKKYPSKMRALEYVLEGMKTPVIYLNISRLTDFRKDAHPSIYRKEYKTDEERNDAEHSQDCSHWCLPGVPDTWNELVYASLLKAGRGSWRT